MGFPRILLTLLLVLLPASAASAWDSVWYDSSRNRLIPVRVKFPRSTEPAPVILFSHGIGGSIASCDYLADTWTAQGFVCVLVQHPGSDENIWKGKIRILNEFRSAFEKNWNCRTRSQDLRFVLNCLEQLVQGEEDFAARIDMKCIGVGGIDLGALSSLLLAGQVPPDHGVPLGDSRIKAVLAMSPPVPAGYAGYRGTYQPITVPALFITGTKDDGIVGTTKAEHRRIPFDSMDQSQRYLITLDGGGHRIYGGRAVSLFASRNDEKYQTAIVKASTCFWKAFLQNNPAALRAMNTYGWESLVGVRASVERRNPHPQSVLIGGNSLTDNLRPNLGSE